MAIQDYSTSPASNTSISGINIAEGCAPSGINDAIRQMMADIASGVTPPQAPTATGTANAIVVALAPAKGAYVTGDSFQFIAAATQTTACTINYGTGGVINLRKRAAGGGVVALAPNDIVSGMLAAVVYDGTQAILLNPFTNSHGADIASASTINLDTATGDLVDVTGTVPITAVTLTEGREATVRFTAATTLTHGASLVLPGGASITTAAGDYAIFRGYASGVVRCVAYTRASGQALVSAASYPGSEGTIASATTTDLGTVGSYVVSVTGGVAITSFGSSASTATPIYFVRFTGAPTLTYNATSLILPGGANITAAAGDSLIAKYEGSGNWRVIDYTRASGLPVVNQTVLGTAQATTSGTSKDFTSIPSGTKRIMVMLNAVSTNGSSNFLVQMGSGSVETSGYVSSAEYAASASTATTGFVIRNNASSDLTSGILTLTHLGSNIWVASGVARPDSGGGTSGVASGVKTFSGTIDRLRFTTVNGTDTFDNGSVNIIYE